MQFRKVSSWGLFSLLVVFIAVITSYSYAYWQVSKEVKSDSKQLLSYIEHKLHVAGLSLQKLNEVEFDGCDYEGQETLEEFLFDHLGAGLFLIRHRDSDPWTYCSVVGNIKVSQLDRTFENIIYLDKKKNRAISFMGYDWQGLAKRDLFLTLETRERINVVRIALEDSYSFFEDDCTDCRNVEVRLSNDDLIFKVGGLKDRILSSERVISDKFPFYIDAVVGRQRVRSLALSSLMFTTPISIMLSLLCFYIISLIRKQHNSLDYQLLQAVQHGEMVAFYQPVIDAKTGFISGAEALVRWVKPDGSIESPALFIQTLEESDLINEVTLQLLKNIPIDLAEVLHSSTSFRCSINLVPQHLEESTFAEQLTELTNQGFPSHQLAIEITERLPLKNLAEARSNIEKMKALGVCVELDDAGTGYGGASYLQELSIDVMKIDKIFIDTLTLSPNRTQVLDAYIQMAKSLGLQIIAEGVEDEAQSMSLQGKGVQLQQGYLFSKPLPAAEFIEFWLQRNEVCQTGESIRPQSDEQIIKEC
ncbi:EAL domain-containing protein [Shewanella sp. UCD-KL12]|uniref:EAL domain-containing protein n=1 Tax=Shewanella sp. UCD-KL12 TaxID=1917163 RepID=UPI0009702AF8|nr:EAL domain-containing protein [Shewanella sp. UCD-KL12]